MLPLSFRINERALVSVDLTVFDAGNGVEGLWLSRILVPDGYRGKQYGSKGIRLLTAMLDRTGLPCYLSPSPTLGRDSLSRKALVAWYERHGWRNVAKGLWLRQPTITVEYRS